MRSRLLTQTFAALALVLAATAAASAQDFQKSYQLSQSGSIRIENVSGNINLSGHEGSTVVVTAFKEGPDRDQVEVEDLSTADRVHLRAKYPSDGCRNCNASLRFEVRVPRSGVHIERISTASGDVTATDLSGRVNLSTASGDVTLQGVSGEIDASTASGRVKVTNASGSVRASSASGDVEVEIARLEGTRDLRFSSASGDVRVRLPNDLDARVHLSTASGQIETDFPIEVKRHEHGGGSTARGQLGGGSRSVRISTASGDVSLKSL